MSEITERQQRILRAIIVEYVDGAEPVPSDLIAGKYEFGVRSATIRNEMAEITERGLLEQPHTSAGRIPSDTGYRYFVDNLTSERQPENKEKTSITSAVEDEDTLIELMRSATISLSRLTHLLTASSSATNSQLQILQVAISPASPGKGLLVIQFANGATETRFVDLDASLGFEKIAQGSYELAAILQKKSIATVLSSSTPSFQDAAIDAMIKKVWPHVLGLCNEQCRTHFFTHGEEYIVAQPEFQRDAHRMAVLLDTLERTDPMAKSVSDQSAGPVTIGKENPDESLKFLSVVKRDLSIADTKVGTIAVIGPTRMDYERIQALLDFTARSLNHTLKKLIGQQGPQ